MSKDPITLPELKDSFSMLNDALKASVEQNGIMATTTAVMMLAGTTLAGSPDTLKPVFLELLTKTVNDLEGRQAMGVVKGKPTSREPLGFAMPLADC